MPDAHRKRDTQNTSSDVSGPCATQQFLQWVVGPRRSQMPMQNERAGCFEPALKATATKSGSSLPPGSWSWIVRGGLLLLYSAAGAHSPGELHGQSICCSPAPVRGQRSISRVHGAIILIWLDSASSMVSWWTTCMPRSSTIDPSPCNGSFHRNHCCIPFRATAATITIVGTPLVPGIAAMKIASGTWGDVHIPAEGSSEDRHHLT